MSYLPDSDRQPEFYADVLPKRFFAWVIDSCAILVLSVLGVIFTGFLGLFVWPLLYLALGFVYRWFTLASWSATPGMVFAGIELRASHGRRFDSPQAFWHTLGYTISIAIPILQVVSVILMVTSRHNQGLSDHLLSSVAINRRVTT